MHCTSTDITQACRCTVNHFFERYIESTQYRHIKHGQVKSLHRIQLSIEFIEHAKQHAGAFKVEIKT